ncbi:MAG: serine hydrolase domain-containing protein [Candidatus Enteromonas sp.]|nr:serine hydrolase domain-containing protein [Candidatus Enteromonas sp.]
MSLYSKNITEKVQKLIDDAAASSELPCYSILISGKGGTQYWQAGYQNIEKRLPISRETVFRIFSCTKIFTSFAAMIACEQGKIRLDQPVKDFLPTFANPLVEDGESIRPAKRDLLVQDLLMMRSGLSYPDGSILTGRKCGELLYKIEETLLSEHPMTAVDLALELGKVPLCADPGSEFRYSISADVLGAVLEVAYGESLDKIFDRMIFKPLGLKDTGFEVPEEKRHRVATAYAKTPEGLIPQKGFHLGISDDGRHNSCCFGGAGLFSTLDDMLRFAQCLLNKGEGLVAPDTFERWVNPDYYESVGVLPWKELPGYRYANLLRIKLDDPKANHIVAKGEFGWDGALGTYIKVDPKNGICYVMATQTLNYGTGPMTRLLRQVLAEDENK